LTNSFAILCSHGTAVSGIIAQLVLLMMQVLSVR